MAENYNQRWPVSFKIYLLREGIARQHLTSFDEFLDNGLQSIIQEVDITLKLKMLNTLTKFN